MAQTTDLDTKLRDVFPEETVNKRLSLTQEVSRLPRFIGEYAIKQICGDNPDPSALATLARFVKMYYPEPKEKDRVLHEIMTRGEYTLLDEFKVRVDVKRQLHLVEIPSLRIHDAMIMPSILEAHRPLLEAGMWGTATLKYEGKALAEEGEEQTPIIITKFGPLQYSGIDLEDFKKRSLDFTPDEWLDVLMSSLGMNPNVYSRRGKLLYISRLIPLVEPNVNIVELGPRATGKSFLFKNISYYTRLYSGGQISPAVLFFHGTFKTIGDIGVRDCVVFDEISRIRFQNPDEMMGKLKDYMESGEFERGMLKRARSGCGLVFMGNIEVHGTAPVEDYSNVMPECMRDSAFVDRIHAFIPGWELPKIEQSDVHLSQGYGFITDYFCEIMHEFRKESHQYHLNDRVELLSDQGKVTIRDQKSIFRVASGLHKLLYPGSGMDDQSLRTCLDLALEYRQRVHDWLCVLSPGEFSKKRLSYNIR
jgi:ATP-dependent Lon protease